MFASDAIATLNPRPGTSVSAEDPKYVTPDLLVERVDEEYVVMLNDRNVPRLRISSAYESVIAANEAGVHALLPLFQNFREHHPGVLVDVRRMHARLIPQEVMLRSVDFGVLTFQPAEKELVSVPISNVTVRV